uniref:Transmembrane protein 14C n=1 Tax=Terrapene triunguis TaxID=2587831 RepID=A0A674HT71_9SAUR
MGLDWVGFGYAALVTSGGIIGYAKAGSVPSLAAGLLFGSLAGLGAYQLSQNPKNVWLSLSESTLKYLCKTNLLMRAFKNYSLWCVSPTPSQLGCLTFLCSPFEINLNHSRLWLLATLVSSCTDS